MFRRLLPAVTAACSILALTSPAAHATRSSGPTAIVSLGDSFISGEAGRWKGNSIVSTTDRAGTDRAWTGTGYDPSRIYGASEATGCHRSDVAEVQSTTTSLQTKANLACSGAVTANIFRPSNGGQDQKGEANQAQKLKYVAQVDNVKVVVLSIGGNDLGFADIIVACGEAYAAKTGPCNPSQQQVVNSRRSAAFNGVAKAIREVRAVMAAAGYRASDWRFIVQSYGSPVPRANEARYSEIDPQRESTGGCPFYDADLNWARDSLVKQISDGLKYVAISEGAEFLDLHDSLQGREVCATASRQATLTDPPSGSTSEWARFLSLNLAQGEVQETLHPNFYAQQALGRCLTLAVDAGPGTGSCRPTPGQGPGGVVYTR
jgi:hypothetical protein